LCAADRESGEVVGVLTVSMPTLNGAWRAAAWPELFGGLGKRELARRVNAELRVISRVIVEPRWRALGVARRLVEAYLSSPLTRCTEAVAAMGRFCPFFVRAGMREVEVAASARDARLGRALEEVRVEAWELVEVERARALMRRGAMKSAIESWGRDARGTRGMSGVELAVAAGAALAARPRVYVSERRCGEA
jgi:hypothetical protein